MKVKSLLKNGIAGALLVVALAPTQASALGLGPYFSAGSGSINSDKIGNGDYSTVGVGVELDTTVASDKVFGYRLQIGYASASYDKLWDANRFEMAHTFGFGVVRSEMVRVWVGPQIGLYYENASENSIDVNQFGASIGPAVGVNVHLGSVVSLAATAYYRFGGYFNDMTSNSSWNDNSTNDSGSEWEAGVNFAVIFRLGGEK